MGGIIGSKPKPPPVVTPVDEKAEAEKIKAEEAAKAAKRSEQIRSLFFGLQKDEGAPKTTTKLGQ